jgi:hypothetical protein
VGGEVMSSPALEQCGNGRAELVEQITELKALLGIERNVSHAAGVYDGATKSTESTAWFHENRS